MAGLHETGPVATDSDNETVTAEAVAMQVINENPETVRRYSTGDLSVLSVLQEKALQAAKGRLGEQELRDTLMRKLGASI